LLIKVGLMTPLCQRVIPSLTVLLKKTEFYFCAKSDFKIGGPGACQTEKQFKRAMTQKSPKAHKPRLNELLDPSQGFFAMFQVHGALEPLFDGTEWLGFSAAQGPG